MGYKEKVAVPALLSSSIMQFFISIRVIIGSFHDLSLSLGGILGINNE
jgi:hypothetical protein